MSSVYPNNQVQQPQPWVGPPSPSPWSPPPAPPVPPAPPQSRRGLVLALVVLAVLGIAGGAYFVTSDGSDTPAPVQAVVEFRQAAERGDCDAFIGMLTDDFLNEQLGFSRDEALTECEGTLEVEASTLGEAEVVSQDGEHAVVEMPWTGEESGSIVTEFELVLVDGRWLIDESTDQPA